eukprot:189671-Prorocentrum_minimum.AAC.2
MIKGAALRPARTFGLGDVYTHWHGPRRRENFKRAFKTFGKDKQVGARTFGLGEVHTLVALGERARELAHALVAPSAPAGHTLGLSTVVKPLLSHSNTGKFNS